MRKYLLIFLLCAGSAGAVTIELTSGMLPYTFGTAQGGSHTTWDTIKVDRAGSESVKLTTTGSGITIGVSRVCIDMSGPDGTPGNADDDTLWWGTDSTVASLRAVYLNTNTSAVVESCLVIRGGYYIHAPDNWYGQEYREWHTGDLVNVGHTAFSLGGIFSHTVSMDSVARVDIRGYRNYVVTPSNDMRIRNSRIFCLTGGFGSRSDFAAGAVWAERIDTLYIRPGVNSGDSNYYNWAIENSYIYSTSQNCVYFGHKNLATIGIPNAAGTYTGNWSVYGAASAYAAVASGDSSISYIYTSGSTSVSESFGVPTFSAYLDRRIADVTVTIQARYITASGAIVRPFVRYGGSVSYGSNISLTSTWTSTTSSTISRPGGGDWWDLYGSDLNDLEVGIQYVSGGTSVAQVSRCVVTVDFDDDDGILKMAYDTLVGDVRNHADMQYTDGYYSTTNSYMLWIQSNAGNSRIHHCRFVSGEEYKGNRAIHLYTINDTLNVEGWLQIDSNYAYTHDGFSTQYPTAHHSATVKIRAGASRIKMFDNDFTMVCDTFNSTNSGGWLYAGDTVPYFWGGSILTLQNNTFNEEGEDRPWRDSIFHNLFKIELRSDDVTHGYSNTSIYAFDNQYQEDSTIVIFGNKCYYYDSYSTYGWPGFDGGGAYVLIHDDTLYYIDTLLSIDSTIVVEDGGTPSDNNIFRDIYWAEGGYTNIESDVIFPVPNAGEDVLWQRTLRLLIQSGERANLSGVIVSAVNNYGTVAFVDTTGSNGIASGIVSYNYQTAVGTDSTGFSPFTLNFDIDGDGGAPDTSISMTVDWQVFSDTLVWGEATYIQKNILLNSGDIRGGVFK